MERFELDEKLQDEIRTRVMGEGFMKIVQTVRRNGKLFKIVMRPVLIGGVRKFQAEMTDEGQVRVKNFDAPAAADGLEEIIAQRGARELHLMTASGDLHVRVTKKGKALVSRSAQMNRDVTVQPHDRVKKQPLTSFDSAALLRTVGIADGEGKIRASMRGKYDQVNEFLRIVGDTVSPEGDKTFTVVDCGCGKAYLTIALWFYLTMVKGIKNVRILGIDRRNDVISAARKMVERLDVADNVSFLECDLSSSELSGMPEGLDHVDMVVSFHACDTATDEAMARGVEWKARYILSAPCCQHELQQTISGAGTVGARSDFAGLLRQNILRERLCDLLTDSFRAMIMRILGFRTQVVEFVSPDATARNILLKCEYAVKSGQAGVVAEYLNLRDYWKVTPWLETRLSKMIGKHLARYE
ncbi:MAG: SAM-dependent methyltransferase [Kiritimatiellae bacterium]|nr:SAM-dependent methyltransferase [Kiritimatiellia bacterium]